MKQQFENNREQLLRNLQSKINQLKIHRNQVLTQAQPIVPQLRVNISQYLGRKGQHTSIASEKTRKMPIKNVPTTGQKPPNSMTEIIRAKMQAKEKCQKLQQLYKQKRQLQIVGIYETNHQKIGMLYGDQKIKKKILYAQSNHVKKQQQKIQKQKIIQQELVIAKSFLNKEKVRSKIKEQQNSLKYQSILKQKVSLLQQYQMLIKKPKLTILQKQKLLQLTFDFLKQPNQKLQKTFLRDYLLTNSDFSLKFYITKEEIMRDLEVHQSSQEGLLTYQQFYEFVKSVEITNKDIKPNLNRTAKNHQVSRVDKKLTVAQSKSNQKTEMEAYLKKLFTYLDQRLEKVVQRQKIEIALIKGLLIRDSKMQYITKQYIKQFGEAIKRKAEVEKDVYKKLDQKYIGLEQLFDLAEKYRGQKLNGTIQTEKDEDHPKIIETQHLQQEKDENINIEVTVKDQIQGEDRRNDFEKYGWSSQNRNNKEQFSQLKQVDQYYHNIGQKYGNQIHWYGIERYRQNFTKFNQCIAKLNQQHNMNQDHGQINDYNKEFEQKGISSMDEFQIPSKFRHK